MLEIDNTEALQGGSSEYVALAEGLYAARIIAIEEGTTEYAGQVKPAAVFKFELAQDVTGGPLKALDGTEFEAGKKVLTKKCNIRSCYMHAGQTKMTNSGQILKAVGVDPMVPKPDMAKALGQICTVQVTNWEKKDGSLGDAIDSVMPFTGDTAPILEKLGPLVVDEAYGGAGAAK